MGAIAKYKNKAHRTAFENGRKAMLAGEPRVAPYGSDDRTTLHFRRAWLDGYDLEPRSLESALRNCVDVMVRSDADAVPAGKSIVFDTEWDAAIAAAQRALSERRCRVCGCTQNHACRGGCSWVDVDLCSACGIG